MSQIKDKIWRILIVEDVQEYSNFIKARLGLLKLEPGIKTETIQVSSAKKARKILKKDRSFDMFLLDVKMETEKAGLDLAVHIKEDLNLATKIMIITGEAGVIEEDVMLYYEIEGFIRKRNFDKEFDEKFVEKLKKWNKEINRKKQAINDAQNKHLDMYIPDILAYLQWKNVESFEFLVWLYIFFKEEGHDQSFQEFVAHDEYLL